MNAACKVCREPHGCAHTDLEYAGIVPPRSTNTQPVMPPAGELGRTAPEASPPAHPVRSDHQGEDNVAG